MLFKDYFNTFIHSNNYGDRLIKKFNTFFRNYAYPYIGEKEVDLIEKKDCIDIFTDENVIKHTDDYCFGKSILLRLFEDAYSKGIIKDNPMNAVDDFVALYYERELFEKGNRFEIRKDSYFSLVAFDYLLNQNYKSNVLDLYLMFVKKYVLPLLYLKKIDEFNPNNIISIGNNMYILGLNDIWKERIMSLLQNIINDVINRGIIKYNPFDHVNLPIVPVNKVDLTEEQQKKIRNIFDEYGHHQNTRPLVFKKIFFVLKGEEFPHSRGITVNEAYEKFEIYLRGIGLRATTIDGYIKICKSNILPCFGETAFRIITIQDLEHFIDAYILLGNTRVKNIIVTIKQLFAFAKENNFIKEDIAKDLKRINRVRIEKDVMNDEEIIQFLSLCDKEEYGFALVLALMLGLRMGETRGLKIDNIDFNNQSILVYSQLDKYGMRVPTKTGDIRRLKIPKHGMEQIDKALELRSHRKVKKKNQFLIVGKEHPFVTEDCLYKTLKRVKIAMNRPDITMHTLRHMNITIGARMKDSVPTIQNNAGHALSSGVTKVYIHKNEESRIQAAKNKEIYYERLLFEHDSESNITKA